MAIMSKSTNEFKQSESDRSELWLCSSSRDCGAVSPLGRGAAVLSTSEEPIWGAVLSSVCVPACANRPDGWDVRVVFGARHGGGGVLIRKPEETPYFGTFVSWDTGAFAFARLPLLDRTINFDESFLSVPMEAVDDGRLGTNDTDLLLPLPWLDILDLISKLSVDRAIVPAANALLVRRK